MIRLVALGSYAYQSAMAIALIFAVSHVLPPAGYTTFSLALASSQLLCVLMFEWLQLAGVRFLAPVTGDEAARLRSSLFVGAGLSSAALVVAGGLAGLASPLSPSVVALGLVLAILQGFSDLRFMMIRVAGRLGAASVLLIARSSLLLAGAVTGAAFRGDATATLGGLCGGYCVALLLSAGCGASGSRRTPRQTLRSDLASFCRYGMLAAGASVIHLSVPVMLRFVIIGGIGEAGPTSAGFSMALDLLQRPFNVLVAAIHTVNYPEVVIQFEHGTDDEARRTTARLFEFVICSTIILLAGIIAFLPDAGRIFVPPDILASFLATAPAATAFYFLHTQLQTTVAIVPHLQKSALRLAVVATIQLLAVTAFTATALALGLSPAGTIAVAAAATAILILLASGPTIRFRAVPRPLLMGETSIAAIVIGSLCALPAVPLAWVLGKIAVCAVLVADVAWRGDFLMLARSKDV